MAVAFGAALGSVTGTSWPLTHNTSAAVPAGGRVVVVLSYFKSGGTKNPSGITAGGNAMTLDKRQTNGNDFCDVWSYYSAAGLGSGVAITATWPDSSGIGGLLMSTCYVTGTLSSGALDATGGTNGTGASLSTGSATNVTADAIYVGGVGLEDPTNPTTSTATNGTEIHDLYHAGSQQGAWSAYLVAASAASRALTATASNSNSTANTGAVAVYAGSGGGGGPTVKHLGTLGVG